jgi:transcriptional regulator with XRE-family HTH domain
MSLADIVRARRKELRWTLRDLGARTGLSVSFLCDLERGRRGIGADSLQALSRELGISMDGLARGTVAEYLGKFAAEIPPSLARFAEESDLPFRHAVVLCRMQQIIMDHRIPSRRISLDRVDWVRFHEAVKEWL